MSAAPRAVVWRERHEPAWLAERTRRALASMGVAATTTRGPEALADVLRSRDGSWWLVRAGAWPLASRFESPPASATARPLLALGAVLGSSDAAASWRAARDLERGPLPAPLSLGAVAGIDWLEQRGLTALAVSGVLSASPLAIAEARRATRLPVLTREELAQPECASRLVAVRS